MATKTHVFMKRDHPDVFTVELATGDVKQVLC